MEHLVHAACVGVVLVCGVANRAHADVASDQAAAILIFPKILVDTSTPPNTKRGPIDTLIRVSNTSQRPISLFCFYINANGHCKNAPTTICDPYDRSGPCGQTDVCEAGWHETDFLVTLSPRQPIAWLASVGAAPCDSSPPGVPCFPFAVSGQPPNKIQPVSEDPFVGELKCIATNFDGVPVDRNDLKGEAELIRSSTTPNRSSMWRCTTRSAFRRSPVPMTATPSWCWVAECVPEDPAPVPPVHPLARVRVADARPSTAVVPTFSSWIIFLTARLIR